MLSSKYWIRSFLGSYETPYFFFLLCFSRGVSKYELGAIRCCSGCKKWTEVWSDEFDGSELDQDKWSFETNCWGGGNDERQCYTDSDKNVSVSDGSLKITAIRERVSGPALPIHMRKTKKPAKHGKTASRRICFISAILTL